MWCLGDGHRPATVSADDYVYCARSPRTQYTRIACVCGTHAAVWLTRKITNETNAVLVRRRRERPRGKPREIIRGIRNSTFTSLRLKNVYRFQLIDTAIGRVNEIQQTRHLVFLEKYAANPFFQSNINFFDLSTVNGGPATGYPSRRQLRLLVHRRRGNE